MGELLAFLNRAERTLNSFVWGPVMLALLVGTGLFLTFRTGGIQFRYFGYIMRSTLGRLLRKGGEKGDGKNLSSLEAVSTALAGTVGTGNIAGVTGAVFLGGPGAVFWMWVSALLGMCTKYVEIALAVRFRESRGGVHRGGPMCYIEKGLGKRFRWLAVVYAIFGGLASFGIGNLAQSVEIAGAAETLFGVPPLLTGGLVAALTGVAILGDVKRIGKVTGILVPVMAGLYLLTGTLILILRASQLPLYLGSVLTGAFTLRGMSGGLCGAAIAQALRQGVAQGVFSNEAGLGSAAIAHAASSEEEPCRQAMWGVFEVFADTIVLCTVTSFAVVVSGVTDTPGGLAAFSSRGDAAVAAFDAILPGSLGGNLLRVSLIFFAFSTILGWSCYGTCCWSWLSGGSRVVVTLYQVVFLLLLAAGAVGGGQRMWEISDTLNGLMAIPNLTALLLLSGVAAKMTKAFFPKSVRRK